MHPVTLFLSALCVFIAVAMGAFGAHGLKTILTPDMLAVYKLQSPIRCGMRLD